MPHSQAVRAFQGYPHPICKCSLSFSEQLDKMKKTNEYEEEEGEIKGANECPEDSSLSEGRAERVEEKMRRRSTGKGLLLRGAQSISLHFNMRQVRGRARGPARHVWGLRESSLSSEVPGG